MFPDPLRNSDLSTPEEPLTDRHNLEPASSSTMISIWPYHFITVTEEQKQQRREALDLRGYYAQCSALILIILLHLYRNYILNGTSTETKGRRVPIRPGEKSWWDSPLFKTGVETRRQYLAALLWLSWLLGLSVWNSGDGALMDRCIDDETRPFTDYIS